MAHAAQRWGTLYSAIAFGLDVTCVDDVTKLLPTLQTLRPQIWGTVPRILEKITQALLLKFDTEPDPQKKAAVTWALDVAARVVAYRKQHGDAALPDDLATDHDAADRTVLNTIRQSLGLDRLRWLVVGAAPTPPHVADFMTALGLNLLEVWGMSELGAVATINAAGPAKSGTVGKPLRDVEIQLAADNEVQVRGPIVMRGYRNDPEKTADALDSDGWLHTGDIGAIDHDGYLAIIDRKKELIVNAAGKNISPLRIEAAVKAASPLIGSVVALGDGKPFVTALIVLDPDVAPAFAHSAGLPVSAISDLADDDAIQQAIDAAITKANEHVSRVEQIKRYKILPDVWEPGGNELTPTLKLRRKRIAERYAPEIETLYSVAEVAQ
jgi:long-subunit acyl-CoA synthetase (AMP-forming)